MERPPPEEPSVGDIYSGKVTSIMQFGCFVQLEGLRSVSRSPPPAAASARPNPDCLRSKRWEGLVHISELRREGRVANVADVVNKGQRVKVKVLSFTGSKTSLSMKVGAGSLTPGPGGASLTPASSASARQDVDQETGEDLNPNRRRNVGPDGSEEVSMRNPDRPSNLNLGHGAEVEQDDTLERKRLTKISDPEKWEIKQVWTGVGGASALLWEGPADLLSLLQMIAANVLSKEEFPDFDDETGILPKVDDEEGE